MKRPLRYCLASAAGAAIVCGIAVAHPAWVRSAGLDFWNVPRFHERVRQAEARELELEAAHEAVTRRIRIKDALVRDLIDGHLTLAEVVDQFAALTGPDQRGMWLIRAIYPGADDREKLTANVLQYVRIALNRDPSRREEVLARLRAERRKMFPDALVR